MEGMGKEKLHFSLLELVKCQKGPLGKSVSANFVTNIINVSIIIHKTQLFSKGQKLILIISGVVRP